MATLATTRRINTARSAPKPHQKNALHWLAGILGVVAFAIGIHEAVHSSLFLLRNVSVTPLSLDYPLSAKSILELAKIPVGSVNLFDVNLEPVKTRLMHEPWVKGVVLGKQFPGTLALTIIERHPVALLTELNGRILYLEDDGSTYEDQTMNYPKDLPIFSGFSAQNIETLKQANQFILTWFSPAHFPGLKVSSLSYDEKLGLRAVITVPTKNQKQLRMVVELGLNIEEASQVPYVRFQRVIQYLSNHSMQASKIWLGDGKKIVVKVLKGT
jgi:hypothetical protein